MKLTREMITNMTEEELQSELLDSMSNTVRDMARKLAITKAIAKDENDISPEEFDKVWNREYSRCYSKLEGKSSHELAIISLAELLAGGADIRELLGD